MRGKEQNIANILRKQCGPNEARTIGMRGGVTTVINLRCANDKINRNELIAFDVRGGAMEGNRFVRYESCVLIPEHVALQNIWLIAAIIFFN